MSTTTDILDTSLPQPTFSLLPQRGSPLPEDMTLSRSSAGRTRDPVTGLYASVPSDEPRIYGAEQSLLVEAAARTNHVEHSSNANAWSERSASTIGAGLPSIIDGEEANPISSTKRSLGIQQLGGGSFSNGEEVAYVIIERGTASEFGLHVQEDTNFTTVAGVDYNWSSGISGVNEIEVKSRKISDNGPARGNEVLLVLLRYDPTAGTDYSGDGRLPKFWPDRNANGNDTIFHHCQIEEAPNASSPIVTQGSSVTRSQETTNISTNDFWSGSEGTLIATITLRQYMTVGNETLIRNNQTGSRYLDFDDTLTPRIFDADAGSTPVYPGTATPFERETYAISFDKSSAALAKDGAVTTTSVTDSLVTQGAISLTANDSGIFAIHSLTYIPRALPAGESDRSAGDPPSLETITV